MIAFMSSFTHQGQEVFYDVRGEGFPVIFQHGLGADRRQGLSAVAALRGYQTIAMDMPGHGETMAGAGRFGFQRFTSCLLGLLDHLELETAAVGGISMGAGIALALALRASERVKVLMLVRPAWLASGSPENLALIARMGHWVEQGGVDFAKEKLAEDHLFRQALANNPGCASSLAGALERPQATESAAVLHELVDDRPFSSMGDLAGVVQPTLVIGNQGDPLHPLSMARSLGEALPKANCQEIPSRYLAPDAHHDALTKALQSFLDRQSS